MVSKIEKSHAFLMVLVCLAGFGCGSKKSAFKIKPNYQMVYNLNTGGDPYNFIVEVVNRDPNLTFNYFMTNEANTSGQIIINKGDLDTSHGQFNYFAGGTKTLNDLTSVWISKKCFQEVVTNKETVFEYPAGFGRKKETFTYASTEDFTVSLNGKPFVVSTVVLKSEKGNMYRILNNPEDPLILEMKIGFTIYLKEINAG